MEELALHGNLPRCLPAAESQAGCVVGQAGVQDLLILVPSGAVKTVSTRLVRPGGGRQCHDFSILIIFLYAASRQSVGAGRRRRSRPPVRRNLPG